MLINTLNYLEQQLLNRIKNEIKFRDPPSKYISCS